MNFRGKNFLFNMKPDQGIAKSFEKGLRVQVQVLEKKWTLSQVQVLRKKGLQVQVLFDLKFVNKTLS